MQPHENYPPHLPPWNEEIAARHRVLYETGLSHTLIAQTLNSEFGINLTRNASIGKAHRAGLSSRETTTKLHRHVQRVRVVVPLQPVAPLNLPFEEITSRFQCRYITNDDMADPLFCGQPTLNGSWCPAHRAICFKREAA